MHWLDIISRFRIACSAASGKFNAKSVVFASVVFNFFSTIDIIWFSPQQMEQLARKAFTDSERLRADRKRGTSAVLVVNQLRIFLDHPTAM